MAVTSPSMIPYVSLPPAVVAEVASRSAARGNLNGKTLMKGDGNATGFTGEELVKALIPGLQQERENRDFDFFLHIPHAVGDGRRATFDVKSRRIKNQPRLDFDCKIPAYQVKRQRCDSYIFTAPYEDYSGGWVLGWISKEDFLKRATLREKGYKHVSGIALKEDHYIIVVKDLNPISQIVDYVERINALK